VLELQRTEFDKAVADLMIIGLFYLLRPGEHTYDKENNHPFRHRDVSFVTAASTENAALISPAALDHATKAHLNFTDQKNGEKDEAITHGDAIDPLLSPLKAVRRRAWHLRAHDADPATPLHTVFTSTGVRRVHAKHIAAALRASCRQIGSQLGIRPKDISAQALRAGGAMALLCSNIDPVLTRLIGRWKSWAMLQCLHRSTTDTSSYASLMLTGGSFAITHHATLPDDILGMGGRRITTNKWH